MRARKPSPERPPGDVSFSFLCHSGRRVVALATVAALLVSGFSLSFLRSRGWLIKRAGMVDQGSMLVDDEERLNTGDISNASPDGANGTVREEETTIIVNNSTSPENDVDAVVDTISTVSTEEGGLPRCYSSPDADPSAGIWRQSAGGIKDSPVDMVDWEHSRQQYGFLHRCDATWNSKHSKEGPRPYWNWEPEKCSLEAVNTEKFCRVMEGRKGILLVGDSLNRLCTTTLASILRATSVVSTTSKDVWKACDDKLTVQFMRNDYLDTGTAPFAEQKCRDTEGRPANNSRCSVFANDHTLDCFDTLVVNSGAHPRKAEEYGDAMRAADQNLAASMKRLHGEDAILVVRNTSPGHWDCTSRMFDGPVDEKLAHNLVSGAPEKYSWHTFHGLNAKLEDAFSAEDGWWLMDVYSPTHVRADTHIGGSDCLHYCAPGPADHWITLLYNILLEATSGQEASKGGQ